MGRNKGAIRESDTRLPHLQQISSSPLPQFPLLRSEGRGNRGSLAFEPLEVLLEESRKAGAFAGWDGVGCTGQHERL